MSCSGDCRSCYHYVNKQPDIYGCGSDANEEEGGVMYAKDPGGVVSFIGDYRFIVSYGRLKEGDYYISDVEKKLELLNLLEDE